MNDSGNYEVTHLIPDAYRIHIEAPGFKVTDIPSVQVSADSSAHVDAAMQVGAVTPVRVEVTGEDSSTPDGPRRTAGRRVQPSTSKICALYSNRNFTSFELLSHWHSEVTLASTTQPPKIPPGGGQIQRQWSALLLSGHQL